MEAIITEHTHLQSARLLDAADAGTDHPLQDDMEISVGLNNAFLTNMSFNKGNECLLTKAFQKSISA